jgi:biopolymer transport protein TolR
MGVGAGGELGQLRSEINVTPMVDVMLVLLVIFMVTTPLITEDDEKRKVDLDLPVTENNANRIDPNDSDKMILEIGKTLVVRVGDEVIVDCSSALTSSEARRFESCFDTIHTKLGQNPRLQEEGELYLLAHADIPYGFVVGAMARIKRAGVNKIGMVTNPEYLDEDPGAVQKEVER